MFLLVRLEASVAELARRVDEFELNLLHRTTTRLSQQRLTAQNTTTHFNTCQFITT